ncbi:MAG: prolyl endopeptidase [Chloroflexota bacterium]|nr:MAG: prolyl endopeptidase [Chloroflexota bacterium]
MTVSYPQPRRADVVDSFFGTPVSDPYRWMEDPASEELRAFIAAENALTHAFLASVPARAALRARLQALYAAPHVPDYGEASRCGPYYFYTLNENRDQPCLYRRRGAAGEPELVLDPNTWSDDGSIIMMDTQPSRDGRLLAYSRSYGGSDWQEYRVRSLETGEDYDDVLAWCKFTRVAWKADGSGFFYNRFPAPAAGREMLAENTQAAIYFHRVGTPQTADTLIFSDPDAPEDLFWPAGSDDGRYLLLQVRKSSVGPTGYYVWEIDSGAPFLRLLADFDSEYEFGGSLGTVLYFITKRDAPKKRLIAFDLAAGVWRDVVPEREDTLEAARVAGGKLVLFYMKNARTAIEVFAPDGKYERSVELPALGSVATYYLETSASDPDFLFTFTSYLYPTTIFRYDVAADRLETFQASGIAIDAEQYVTRQVFYPSTDGAVVSMFLTHRRDLPLDGSNRALIYAYGGFDWPNLPQFEVPYYLWIEQGGVLAVPNLRGGGEYGESWHRAGMREQKQHVFDDMLAAAEWLIDQRYTSRERLAIRGLSNGGLLVGACLTQRPDLFAAALCLVPVTDMLRYHRFTSGRLWVSEYGCAEASAEEFAYLYAYSPLHNVRAGAAYPATLIATADGDDRVVPMHSLKFAAALQAAQAGPAPILLRYGTDAGHGTLTVNKLIEEESDYLAFLAANLK